MNIKYYENKVPVIISITCLVLACCVLLTTIIGGFCNTNTNVKVEKTTYVDPKSTSYIAGVNNALDTMILLSLELTLKKERRTWGEMRDIVSERLLGTTNKSISAISTNNVIKPTKNVDADTVATE